MQSLNEIDLDCLPGDIPESIDADISELGIGQVLKVENLNISDQLEIKTPGDQTIASVTHAMQEEEETTSDEESEEFMDGDSDKTSEDGDSSQDDDSGEGNES